MSNLSVPRFRIQDALGNAVNAGKLYFYEPGTTTLKNTYSTAALTPGTENTNPVVAGADGWCGPIYLSAAQYKIVAKDSSGNTLWTEDNTYPARSESTGEATFTSTGANPAITGTNSSTGPGVKAVNSGSGHALWAEGDTTSPAKAAIHIVPQDSTPSSPVKGDLRVDSASGLPAFYNGSEEARIEGVVYAPVTTSSGACPFTATETYSIPANSLRVGDTIEIEACMSLTAGGGGGEVVTCNALVGGVVVATHAVATGTSALQKHCLRALARVASVGAGGTMNCCGSGDSNNSTSPAPTKTVLNAQAINTTIANAITFTATRAGGAAATVRLDYCRVSRT